MLKERHFTFSSKTVAHLELYGSNMSQSAELGNPSGLRVKITKNKKTDFRRIIDSRSVLSLHPSGIILRNFQQVLASVIIGISQMYTILTVTMLFSQVKKKTLFFMLKLSG